MKQKWTKEEIDLLVSKYNSTTKQEMMELLNRTDSQIKNKARKMNLKKDKSIISLNIGRRNKMVGRDLSYEFLKEIARKYKTRFEFQCMDGSAYTISRIKGYLDEICSHMISKSVSTPQLILKYIFDFLLNSNGKYNDRKTLSPYEIDIYKRPSKKTTKSLV